MAFEDSADIDVDVLLILSVELAEAGEKEPAEMKVEAVGYNAIVGNVAVVVDVVVVKEPVGVVDDSVV